MVGTEMETERADPRQRGRREKHKINGDREKKTSGLSPEWERHTKESQNPKRKMILCRKHVPIVGPRYSWEFEYRKR